MTVVCFKRSTVNLLLFGSNDELDAEDRNRRRVIFNRHFIMTIVYVSYLQKKIYIYIIFYERNYFSLLLYWKTKTNDVLGLTISVRGVLPFRRNWIKILFKGPITEIFTVDRKRNKRVLRLFFRVLLFFCSSQSHSVKFNTSRLIEFVRHVLNILNQYFDPERLWTKSVYFSRTPPKRIILIEMFSFYYSFCRTTCPQ